MHKSMNRPLTILGAERGLFFTALCAGAGVFNLLHSLLGGLTYAYGEGHSKRTVAGIVFGVGMAIGAVNFMSWLFPGV